MPSKTLLVCLITTFIAEVIALAPPTNAQPAGPLDNLPEGTKIIATVENPEPDLLPSLAVWQHDKLILVAASFPNLPGFVCDSWCYESPVEFLQARALPAGRLQLRHRLNDRPDVILVTTVTPEPGALEFLARAETESGADLPANLLVPNMCWQLQRAAGFMSKPDPYPDFVKRCFIFTPDGRAFLGDTVRRLIPCRPPDDPYNNPPWVQMYLQEGRPQPDVPATSWADYSTDRYTVPVIGAVSRDAKHLAALANGSATMMAQAWHDCMHNNPPWLPADAPPAQREWRIKVYALRNDPQLLLERVARDFPQPAPAPQPDPAAYQTPAVEADLPVFRERLKQRMSFPLSWLAAAYADFDDWKTVARRKVFQSLLTPPPPAPFDPVTIAEEDRGEYLARKLVFNVTADSRVLAYMLVPKGQGPFPAVLLLHDHGARLDIGKEKMIRPFAVPQDTIASAQQWVNECYGGRWIGDELAKRGYLCFSTDAINWSDRGGAGFDGQQALASNLFHLGSSFAGLIAWEDLRAAEFLSTRPEVDPARVAAMGLSMGSYRTWQLAALSDHVAAGVAICWMACLKDLMVPGQNQTVGSSAFSMLHPNLRNYLDFPDLASLACPKPMLFYNGAQDGLFPIPSVEQAYDKMRRVWESQAAAQRLETKVWDVPHVFNLEMQEQAFAWLARQLPPATTTP